MGWGPSTFGWFPSNKNEEQGFRLDIVSLLAVIGESSMAEQSQALTASWLCVLPRLLPAPQVLLKANRPFRMPSIKVEKVIGVHGGTILDTLNYFPNILHPTEDMRPLGFKVLEIKHNRKVLRDEQERRMQARKPSAEPRSFATMCGIRGRNTHLPHKDLELGRRMPHLPRSTTLTPEQRSNMLPALVPVKSINPLTVLDILSFFATLGILGVAIWNRDGIACLALATLSAISSIVGYASKWQPSLMTRPSPTVAPRGDIIIRTREGAFIVVKCTEEVARELYTGTEQCEYVIKNSAVYRAMVGVATFLLMCSVVLLGNCKFYQQLAIGVAYIILNGLYWLVSLTKKQRLWDLRRYDATDVTEKSYREFLKAHEVTGKRERQPSFTRTLWYTIFASESTSWCKKSDAMPKTAIWEEWLVEADKQMKEGNQNWDAVKYKNELMEKASTEQNASSFMHNHAHTVRRNGDADIGEQN